MVLYSPIEGGGVEVMQITYQKNDGCIFQRYRNTTLPYKIGETTSMGWKVLNIEYEYEDNYYQEHEYHALIKKSKDKLIKKHHNVELFINEFKKFLYYLIAVMILKLITLFLGI